MTDVRVDEITTDDIVKEMVSRFLCWKLPKDFAPDAGISFKPTRPDGYDAPGWWPIGTNLLHAGQAEEMVRHILGLPNGKLTGGASAELDELRSERKRLRAALELYGRHGTYEKVCACTVHSKYACDCGLNAALSATIKVNGHAA